MRRLAQLLLLPAASLVLGGCASMGTLSDSTKNGVDASALSNIARFVQPEKGVLTPVPGIAHARRQQILVFQPTAMPGPRVVNARTAPVNVSRVFPASPYNPAKLAFGETIPLHAPDRLSRWVLVSGNYTPKGVYSRPDSSSRILIRVAPGSRLRLEKAVDGWLKVETDRGTGYLQAHDGKLLANAPGAKPRVIKPAFQRKS